LILGVCPEAEVRISYGVPRYRAPNGRYVFLGLWKQGVSLHAVNFEVIADFKERYPQIKTGKGSLNLKTTDTFTDTAVKKVLKKVLS
jgi:uncharacterized protein YdhG (YjbR/CyaY superfamily)